MYAKNPNTASAAASAKNAASKSRARKGYGSIYQFRKNHELTLTYFDAHLLVLQLKNQARYVAPQWSKDREPATFYSIGDAILALPSMSIFSLFGLPLFTLEAILGIGDARETIMSRYDAYQYCADWVLSRIDVAAREGQEEVSLDRNKL